MRNIILLIMALGLSGCMSSNPDIAGKGGISKEARIIEESILWKAKINRVTWEPIKLARMLKDGRRFTEEGQFYAVNDEIVAFGQKVLYIGLVGLDMFGGPNAMLEGSPAEIAEYITQHYGVEFINNDVEYQADIGPDLRLYLAPHPERENTTLIIGAYLGP